MEAGGRSRAPAVPPGGPRRWLWLVAGFVAVALGTIGIVVPVLPTTGFFVLAASCFARSSPRFEAWVLNLPKVGPLVRDYRDGLGMPRRAKVVAMAMIAIAVGLSATFGTSRLAVRLGVVLLGVVGVWYVGLHVPTRERVLRERASE